MPDSMADLLARIDARTDLMQKQMDRLESRLELVRDNMGDMSLAYGERIKTVEVRTGVWGIFSVTAAAIAGWLGMKY